MIDATVGRFAKAAKHAPVLPGSVYGALTALEAFPDPARRAVFWLCQCACGEQKRVAAGALQTGRTRSCGCQQRQFGNAHRLGHGGKGTRLFRVWIGMRSRCRNPNEPGYVNYGGRGIYVCDEWQDFVTFRDWALAAGYADSLSIDRIDNDGPYAPDNCRFADQVTQARNRRTTKLDEQKVAAIRESNENPTALAKRHGVSRATIRSIIAGKIWLAARPSNGDR